jgi:hypothetical protein
MMKPEYTISYDGRDSHVYFKVDGKNHFIRINDTNANDHIEATERSVVMAADRIRLYS